MKREIFYDTLRGSAAFPVLTAKQVEGLDLLLDVWGQWHGDEPIELLAAALTQIHHETGGRMQPVMETFSSTAVRAAQILEASYVAGKLPWVSKRYWLPDGNGKIFIGRGGVQITHKTNYAKQRRLLKEIHGVDVPLDEDPELAMHPVVSAEIAFNGMIHGLFRSNKAGAPIKLADFLKGDQMDYVGQRNVVNGDSKDDAIAKKMAANGKLFERALKKAAEDGKVDVRHPRELPGTQPRGSEPAPTGLTRGESRVKDVQERLIKLGYGDVVGEPDGAYGPKTGRAIEAFEAANNIKLDHIDAATWDKLKSMTEGQ